MEYTYTSWSPRYREGGGPVDFLGWRDEMALEPEKGGGGKPDHSGTIVSDLFMEVEF